MEVGWFRVENHGDSASSLLHRSQQSQDRTPNAADWSCLSTRASCGQITDSGAMEWLPFVLPQEQELEENALNHASSFSCRSRNTGNRVQKEG